MELHGFDDTIAAVSTPPGQSGIGIVRLSGPGALGIADEVFRPADPTKIPSVMPSHTMAYGCVVEDGDAIDEVLLTVMRAPKTYTVQDVVEINCHGGMVPLRRALEAVLSRGARLADPGEFTKRAFLFGRIDLAQAESVADIISARTEDAHRAAMSQLEGRFSEQVNALREGLLEALVHLEAAIDFADEGIEPMSAQAVAKRCRALSDEMRKMIEGSVRGRVLREGVRTAIVGRPNVGKSSLMNALLGQDRVIVTCVPGTTRDVVEDTVSIRGVPFILADTAGLRESDDVIESAGVERSRSAMAEADLVLLVLDGSEALVSADRDIIGAVPAAKTVVVVNKQDLPEAFGPDALVGWEGGPIVAVSAKERTGIGEAEEAIAEMIWGGSGGATESALVTNVRHQVALERARGAVGDAERALERRLSEEYVASDLREALDALGGIVGATAAEDVINRIFETFCIGK